MLMVPPRPKRNYSKVATQENLQVLVIKQFTQYYPSIQQKVLKVSQPNITNTSRPASSKLQLQYRSQKSNSITVKRVNTSAIRNSTKSQNQSMEKLIKQGEITAFNIQQKPLAPVPTISSKYWGIYESKSDKLVYGNRVRKRIEVASLTKIMNLFTIVELLTLYELDPKNIRFPVSQWACSMIGTTANLEKRDVLTLQALIYGMMLPSGNDAATQIAMIGGLILKLAQLGRAKKIYERLEMENLLECRSNIIRYIGQMNKISLLLGMKQTKWTNVHGLSNKQNKTTIEDMCILSKYAMQNEYIRNIVNTKTYSCQVQSYFSLFNEGQPIVNKTIVWQNTNKMLWKGWNGIKTGVTPNAGPCLAALYCKKIANKDRQFIVIIANCLSMNQRWQQVETLVEWAIQRLQH